MSANEETYTNRRIEKLTLKRIDGMAVVSTDGTGSGAPQEVIDILKPGDEYELELRGFNEISGYRVNGEWISRLSDQELKKKHDDAVAEARQKHIEFVDSHKEEYDKMEEELPDWAKKILEINRLNVEARGEDWDYGYMARGYTLVALKLAVLYSEAGDIVKDATKPIPLNDIPDNIKKYLDDYGVSGNQESWAQFVAHGYLNRTLEV